MKRTDVIDMGRIPLALYRQFLPDITTDEVIITGERIEHIKERHPQDFERYRQYMRDIIAEPDYIMEANKPNSVMLMKEFVHGGRAFKMILRLHTSVDDPEHKNSIITFMRIKGDKYKQYARTKKILYKRV